jgi:predicted MPP superfamily phosphohydrolase
MQLGLLALLLFALIVFLDNKIRVLPDSIHGHLPIHHPGFVVTDVTLTTCSTINIFSSCVLDPKLWHKVPKDLYLDSSWTSSAFLYVQRKKEEELLETDKVVLDLKIGRLNPGATGDKQAPEEWEPRPGGIWLRRTAQRHASDSEKVLTSIDVLFRPDAVDPRPNWEVKDNPLLLNSAAETQEARITVRRGAPPKNKKPTPRINENGKFKIMQVADLHLSTGLGKCQDPVPAEPIPGQKCDADIRTLEFVERLLDDEKPDLIVLTGDQLNGKTAKDVQSAILKFAKLFIDRKIPYASIFGNHDDEGNFERKELMTMIEDLPYSLSEPGPDDVDGIGNYIVEVLGPSSTTHSALTLYLLDTHSYSPDERQFRGYDWLKPSQIKWFKNKAQSLKKKHDQYTHMHMNMAFIHIPLPEYRDSSNYWIGNWTEPTTAPGFNSGFKDALVDEGVLFVSCGQ